jgi:2-keto-4-pentenoate hydratase/2-oxohepta-3-ene-1,7-dioic acid hydratase in catechol pathway
MIWSRFRSKDGRVGFGTLADGYITEYAGDMFGESAPAGGHIARGEYELLCPCVPSKIIGLWNNFGELSLKLGKPAPAHPLFFLKPATSVIGSGEAIRRPAGYAGKIAYEGELGIVIGKHCKEVQPEIAGRHIFGYTCVNDVTAVGVLDENPDFAQWCRSKGYDTFACLGPVIATGLDWRPLRVVTRLDGVERQNYPLSDMIMPPQEVVSRLSYDMSLLPGDVIACGTSVGVGSIKDGCAVEVSIEGIGSLVNMLKGSPI